VNHGIESGAFMLRMEKREGGDNDVGGGRFTENFEGVTFDGSSDFESESNWRV